MKSCNFDGLPYFRISRRDAAKHHCWSSTSGCQPTVIPNLRIIPARELFREHLSHHEMTAEGPDNDVSGENLASRSVERPAAVTVLSPLPQPGPADEINHRIANSLQLVLAMVAVEGRGIQDPAARTMLETVQRRIGAIASVHRQLYQSRNVDLVDLGRYLPELGTMLEQGCADPTSGRRIIVQADRIAASSQAASSVGIIISELVNNACKHAYSYGMPGHIRVTLTANADGGYGLIVEDRGRGLSTLRCPEGTGLGRQLITMMASRLGGAERWEDARPGTRFVLEVPKA